jgi:hypothetical protein
MIAAYDVHVYAANSLSVADFLLYTLKPQPLTSEGSRDLLITLVTWMGLTTLGLTALETSDKIIPANVLFSSFESAIFLLILLLPLILLWFLWPFDVVFKLGWTLCYFSMVYVLLYWYFL